MRLKEYWEKNAPWNALNHNCEHVYTILFGKDYDRHWIEECSKCKGQVLNKRVLCTHDEYYPVVFSEHLVAVGT